MEANPLFAAGIRGFERLKWEYLGARQLADQVAQTQAREQE